MKSRKEAFIDWLFAVRDAEASIESLMEQISILKSELYTAQGVTYSDLPPSSNINSKSKIVQLLCSIESKEKRLSKCLFLIESKNIFISSLAEAESKVFAEFLLGKTSVVEISKALKISRGRLYVIYSNLVYKWFKLKIRI